MLGKCLLLSSALLIERAAEIEMVSARQDRSKAPILAAYCIVACVRESGKLEKRDADPASSANVTSVEKVMQCGNGVIGVAT